MTLSDMPRRSGHNTTRRQGTMAGTSGTLQLELNAGVIADTYSCRYARHAFMESLSNGKHELEWYNRRKSTKICFFDRRRSIVEL
jgi:hypothetical protein